MAELSVAPGDERRAAWQMLAVTLLWGAFFVCGKWAVAEAPPMAVGVLRFAIATVLMGAWLTWQEPSAWRLNARGWLLAGAMGLAGGTIYNGLSFYALQLAPATDGAMISPALNPMLTILLAAPLFGERLTAAKIGGVALGVLGLGLIFIEPMQTAAAGPSRFWGDLLFVAAAVAWSTNTLLVRASKGLFSPLACSTYVTVFGWLFMLPLAWADLGRLHWGALSAGFWGSIVFMAVGCTVVAFWLFYDAIGRVGASRTASYLLLIPVFGLVLGMVLLGERPSALQLAGMTVTLLGVWTATRPRPSPQAA